MVREHITTLLLACATLSASSLACQGDLLVDTNAPSEQTPGVEQGAPESQRGSEPGDEGAPDGPRFASRDFSASPGIRRLSAIEYRHTVRDLTGVELDRALPAGLVVEGHGQIAGAQKIGYEDVARYVALAEQIASLAMPAFRAQSGCGDDDQGCWEGWARGFLRKALRGPVPDAFASRYEGVLSDDRAGESASARAETLVALALASPWFLYRSERGEESVEGRPGAMWLHDHEIASRLSYLVWQSAPDEDLLDVAATGGLTDRQRRLEQLERMLADERAEVGVQAFVGDWMGLFGEAIPSKDAGVLEGTNEQLAQDARDSFNELVARQLLDDEARYVDLLSIDRFPVNGQLAAVLGVAPPEDDQSVEWRDLDPAERVGLLTHPLVIAAHTKESGASPFPLGAFVYDHVLCETIPAPPQLPSPEQVQGAAPGSTLRQQLEAATAGDSCQGCHTRIGPVGFSFLPFDPIGRHSARDGEGRLFDTSGQIPVKGETLVFEGASDLSVLLSEHPSAARCVADRLFRWSYGRFEGPGDEDALGELRALAANDRASAVSLLRAIVASDSFLQVRHEVSR